MLRFRGPEVRDAAEDLDCCIAATVSSLVAPLPCPLSTSCMAATSIVQVEVTTEQLVKVQEAANATVAANVPVRKFSMPFEAATAKYGRVFLDSFYPAKGSNVDLLFLPGVTFNIIDQGFTACSSTAPIGRIELCGFESEPTLPGNPAMLTAGAHVPVSKQAKGKVELRFRIAAEAPAGSMEADAAAAAAAAAAPFAGPEPAELEGLHWTVEKKKAGAAAAAATGAAAGGAGAPAAGGAGSAAPAAAADSADNAGKKGGKKAADAAKAAAPAASASAAGSEPPDCTPGATAGDDDNAATGAGRGGEGQLVTPWEVEAEDEGGIDYDKLIRDFGCSYITVSRVAARPTRRPCAQRSRLRAAGSSKPSSSFVCMLLCHQLICASLPFTHLPFYPHLSLCFTPCHAM